MSKTLTYALEVFWEDTDAGGIVYHANYLKFMERARSKALSAAGIDQKSLMEHERKFVVSHMDIRFAKSATLEDTLHVETELLERKRTYLVFDQRVLRENTLLCQARVTVAMVNNNGRPSAMPEALVNAIEATFK